VLGEPFDLWRISDALEVLGCPPEAAGIVEGQLILRAGYTYAVVMRLYTSQSDFEEVNAGWP
jgi:predicted metal-binding protein